MALNRSLWNSDIFKNFVSQSCKCSYVQQDDWDLRFYYIWINLMFNVQLFQCSQNNQCIHPSKLHPVHYFSHFSLRNQNLNWNFKGILKVFFFFYSFTESVVYELCTFINSFRLWINIFRGYQICLGQFRAHIDYTCFCADLLCSEWLESLVLCWLVWCMF